MNTTLINLILCIPFVAVLIIVAPIYLTSGYKRGLWRALVSLGATVFSIIISVYLAKFVGWLIAMPLSNIIPKENFESFGIFKELAFTFAKGVVQVVLTFLLFVLFLIISLIVVKLICNKIKDKKLDTDKKSLKWGGLGIRFIDSVVVSLMVALPVYGVLATYVPPIAAFNALSAPKDSESVQVLDAVVGHPIVESYKVGPSAWVFEGLSDFGVNGENINPAKISNVAYGVVSRFEKIMTGDEESRIEACAELGRYVRDNVIGEPWSYDIVCAVSKELEKQVNTLEDEELKYEAQRFMPLLDLTQEEYEDNGYALLDFLLYAFEDIYVEFLNTEDESVFTEDYYSKLGDLINHSEHALMLKELILEECAVSMYRAYLTSENRFEYNSYGDVFGYDPAYEDAYNEYDKKITSESKRLAKEYIDKHFDGKKMSKANRVKEAKAFSHLFVGGSGYSEIEGFSMYPGFGVDSVKDLLSPRMVMEDYQHEEHFDQMVEEYKKHPELHDFLIKKLSENENISLLYDTVFTEYVSCVSEMLVFSQFEDLYIARLYYSSETLKETLDYLGEDFFVNSKLKKGKEAYVILYDYAEAMINSGQDDSEYSFSVSPGFVGLYELVCMADSQNSWPSSISYSTDDLNCFIQDALGNTQLEAVLSNIISKRGNDPFGVNSKLSYNQKQTFKYIVEQESNGRMIDMNGFMHLDKESYDRIAEEALIYNELMKNNCEALKNFFQAN